MSAARGAKISVSSPSFPRATPAAEEAPEQSAGLYQKAPHKWRATYGWEMVAGGSGETVEMQGCAPEGGQ